MTWAVRTEVQPSSVAAAIQEEMERAHNRLHNAIRTAAEQRKERRRVWLSSCSE